MGPTEKLKRLKAIIADKGSVLIAFSGGLDSTFLLKVASLVLAENKVLAVTADSPTYPKEELLFSKSITRRLGVKHKIIKTQETKDKRFLANPVNRCYFCKSELFRRLKREALKLKLNFVLDATNASDKNDFRPGSLAKKEFKISSPLEEAGISKKEVRILSRKLGLKTWDKPSSACLASRVPYGMRISLPILDRIHRAEIFLKKIGFRQVRLRHYGNLCRIEVIKEKIPAFLHKRNLMVARLKRLGYNYITLDLEGFRSGSMNEGRKRG